MIDIHKVIKHQAFIPTCVGLVSFGAGVGAGFLLAKQLNKEEVEIEPEEPEDDSQGVLDFDLAADVERSGFIIDEEGYRASEERIKYGEEFVADMTSALNDGDSEEPVEEVEAEADDQEDIRVKVEFASGNDWDEEAERASRDPEKPYIIHQDEYFEHAESGKYRQMSLVYYEGDDTVCDEKDVEVENYERVLGKLIFGHGSTDLSSVYIRNEKLMTEYEVLKLSGHYKIEVLGLQMEDEAEAAELRHSKNHKFRDV